MLSAGSKTQPHTDMLPVVKWLTLTLRWGGWVCLSHHCVHFTTHVVLYISSRFSSNFEADASEILENFEVVS